MLYIVAFWKMHEEKLRIDIFVKFINYQKQRKEIRKKLLNCHWPLQWKCEITLINADARYMCIEITEVQRVI